MHLSTHFTLAELTRTSTGLPNVPPQEVIDRLKRLAIVLEEIRTLLGVPLRVNSGYRSPAVNKAIGGAKSSQHMLGEAADIVPVGISVQSAMKSIAAHVKSGALAVDQLIVYPSGGFLHVSYREGGNRGQLLTSAASGGSGGPYSAWKA